MHCDFLAHCWSSFNMRVSFRHIPYCTSRSKFLCFCIVPLLAWFTASSILSFPDFTMSMRFSCISLLSCRNNESLSQELWLFFRQAHAVIVWLHLTRTVEMRKFYIFGTQLTVSVILYFMLVHFADTWFPYDTCLVFL